MHEPLDNRKNADGYLCPTADDVTGLPPLSASTEVETLESVAIGKAGLRGIYDVRRDLLPPATNHDAFALAHHKVCRNGHHP
jgi:hypothetical protein